MIPKTHQPGKWHLILDLSSPGGHSVNNGIPKDPYSLKYVTVDDAICSLVDLGPDSFADLHPDPKDHNNRRDC